MELSSLLVVFGVAVLALALLLGGRISPAANKAAEVASASLASINIAGILGLGWFVVENLLHEGVVMVIELSACASLMALLIVFTGGGLALTRRGNTKTGMALLAAGAVPTIFVYGFLVYLDFNPIDCR